MRMYCLWADQLSLLPVPYAVAEFGVSLNHRYGLWADKRTELTGREALDVILTRRNALNEGKMGSNCRDEDGVIACDLPVPAAKPTATK